MALTKSDLKSIKEIVYDPLNKQIENLAISVAKGFAGVDEQFRAVDRRFDEADLYSGRIEKKLDATVDQLDDHGQRIVAVEKKLKIKK